MTIAVGLGHKLQNKQTNKMNVPTSAECILSTLCIVDTIVHVMNF